MARNESAFSPAQGGASLLLAFKPTSRIFLVIGGSTLAASRALAALEAEQTVVVLLKGGTPAACEELRCRANHGELAIIDTDSLPSASFSTEADLETPAIEAYLASPHPTPIALVCVTDTLLTSPNARPRASAERIYHACRSVNIPVNVTDMPDLCDFTFAASHRFVDSSSSAPGRLSPLQIGVTTNGQGCRLSTRIRREIVAALPRDAGAAVSKIGELRNRAKADSATTALDSIRISLSDSTPNIPVPQTPPIKLASQSNSEAAKTRMRWIAQMSEFWPISRLARLTQVEMCEALSNPIQNTEKGAASNSIQQFSTSDQPTSQHSIILPPQPGKILLVGSGPGHPGLLTLATHVALTQSADLVLSDKLVPASVLDLIPPHVEVRIARKFPGNADGAQNELMEAAVEAAKQGKTVVRLKQGDPSVYGRAGEEILHFRSHGFEPLVIPGVSSALAGPTFAGIPVTQRGVAESLTICTGVGRAGKAVRLPGYLRSQTLVLLMGVARLPTLVEALCAEVVEKHVGRRRGRRFPPYLPIAIVERASMRDQRVLTSTLGEVCTALESAGEQRPPGMIVIGWAVLALWGKGDMGVLDDTEPKVADHKCEDDECMEEDKGEDDDRRVEADRERVSRWLGDRKWRVQEGIDEGWSAFNSF